MKLILEDGTLLEGWSFGADRDVRGEVVFNTGLTGYPETLTDPSYRGQILVMTYPLQGNYGVPKGPFESHRIQVQGLVVTHYSSAHSHHASVKSLGDWLKEEGIPAIEGIDTRSLTRRLRKNGTMDGYLLAADASATPHEIESRKAKAHAVEMKRVVEDVVPERVHRFPGGDLKILVIDTGAKENIQRSLQARGATVILAPFSANWEPMLNEVDGVMLTNGPGDPQDLGDLVGKVKTILAKGVPTFGICLGHQLLSLAAGANTYKLKYGHRSQNQPVMELSTQRAYVTSQNHGYAVDDATLPSDWEPWFRNLNDGTNEGIRHRFRPFRSVQFHPEASSGPHDTAHLFDDFLRMAGDVKMTNLVS